MRGLIAGALACWAFLTCPAWPQPLRVSGAIVDRDAKPVRTAVLTLSTKRAGGPKARTKPNEYGEFFFPPLEPGVYELVCEARGFQPVSVPVKGAYGGNVYTGLVILDRQIMEPRRAPPLPDSKRIVDASVSNNHNVRILFANRAHIEVPPEKDQVACSSIAVADEGSAAGWFVEYVTDGVSYSVAFTLIVFRPGRPIRHFGNGMPLYDWHFVNGGRQVEFTSGPLHGPGVDHPTHEHWDIRTGRKIKEWQDPE